MIRTVLDTNVLISALILKGPTNQIADLWKQKKFVWLISKNIAQEYLRVLAYPKFKLSVNEIKTLAEQEIFPFTMAVDILKEPKKIVLKDPSNDHFLACAFEGKADYLVSSDEHLISIKVYGKTKIISVSDFLTFF